jgi:ubiquitin C-terminal hydrolase
MAFLAQLKGSLQGRKKYIDNVSTSCEGTGEGISLTNAKGKTKFYSFNDFKDKSKTGFCGLKNQGATCYLNSLLQALYLTPGLKQHIYDWRYDASLHPPKEKCPMYQLQSLFAEMELSDKCAVSTLGLTNSFGWFDREAFQQQDVQEMKGAILQILETSSEKLYQYVSSELTGVYISYINFIGTEYKRQKEEEYKDVQLAIKGLKSVHEALKLYVLPEVMNGDNQIQCDELGGKSDAHKGIKFKTLPNILSLQLRRFEMDWVRMCQIKLSDAITIPLSINLKEYITDTTNGTDSTNGGEKKETNNSNVGDDEEWIYDLYAVLVHSGSAMGGHYFSYMRTFQESDNNNDNYDATGKWYNFNDATVTELAPKTLSRVLGGEKVPKEPKESTEESKESTEESKESTKESETKSNLVVAKKGLKLVKSSSNAYMLMYHRRSSRSSSSKSTSSAASSIPKEMLDAINKANVEYNKNKKEFNIKRDTYNLRIFQKDTKTSNGGGYTTIPINCNETIGKLKESIVSAFNKKGEKQDIKRQYTTRNIRLREYDTIKNLITNVLDDDLNKTIIELKLSKSHPIMIEYNENEIFLNTWNSKTTLSLCVNQEDQGTMLPPVQMDVEKTTTLNELYVYLTKLTKWKNVRIILPSKPSNVKTTTSKGNITRNTQPYVLPSKYHLEKTNDTDDVNDSINGLSTMEELQCMHGMNIYVEEEEIFIEDSTTMNDNIIINESNSSILFQLGTLNAMITLKFNGNLNDKQNINNSEKKEIVIDSRLNLYALKKNLSQIINIPINEFIMKRTQHSEMWKDLNSLIINEVGLRNKSSLYLSKGTQMKPTEYSISLYEWNSIRGTLILLKKSFIIDKLMTVKDIKNKILNDNILSKTTNNLNFNDENVYKKLRLRNCVEISNRAGKAWCNHLTLEESNGGTKYLKDDMEVCVEILQNSEELTEDSLLINIRRWHPSKQVLDEPNEMVLLAKDTLGDLKQKLVMGNDNELDVKNISVGKPFAWQLKDPKINLPHIKWDFVSDIGELKKDMRLDHGSVLVYKNKLMKEVIIEEKNDHGNNNKGRRGGGGGGIKIYSFQEQLERAAAKKKKAAEEKQIQEDARIAMAERIKVNITSNNNTDSNTDNSNNT